jgi:hypothetical protein
MQERYLGDSHDFVKFALLRHVATTTKWPLGLNWYLSARDVDHPENQDGEQRHHMAHASWQGWDDDLRARLEPLQDMSSRKLAHFYKANILPTHTHYHDQVLQDAPRAQWHAAALQNLNKAQFVFLDPDNGFAVPSMTQRRAAKYVLPHEFAEYAAHGQIVTTIQFAHRKSRDAQLDALLPGLKAQLDQSRLLPVLHIRTAPNTYYISACPAEHYKEALACLSSFAAKSLKIELV